MPNKKDPELVQLEIVPAGSSAPDLAENEPLHVDCEVIDANEAPAMFYSSENIRKIDALYNVVIGTRSNGKTFDWCRDILDEYFNSRTPSAYIRRLDTMLDASNIGTLFDPHLDWIKEKYGGKWNTIIYKTHAYYLARYEDTKTGGRVKTAQDTKPFCRTYAINTVETTKGADRGKVYSVCFDEFITRTFYLTNEFVMFQNLLSSIIRNRPGVKIWMIANTVNKSCPYFREMGIRHIKEMQPGQIDVYRLGKTDQKIAVEYCEYTGAPQAVSEYFAFDNPELRMITAGSWEIASYRHPPKKLGRSRILISFWIEFEDQTLQGDIHMYDGFPIMHFHPCSELKPEDRRRKIIYVDAYNIDGNPLHQVTLRARPTRAHDLIARLIAERKTFFADNECGEVFANWALQTQKIARESI